MRWFSHWSPLPCAGAKRNGEARVSEYESSRLFNSVEPGRNGDERRHFPRFAISAVCLGRSCRESPDSFPSVSSQFRDRGQAREKEQNESFKKFLGRRVYGALGRLLLLHQIFSIADQSACPTAKCPCARSRTDLLKRSDE